MEFDCFPCRGDCLSHLAKKLLRLGRTFTPSALVLGLLAGVEAVVIWRMVSGVQEADKGVPMGLHGIHLSLDAHP